MHCCCFVFSFAIAQGCEKGQSALNMSVCTSAWKKSVPTVIYVIF
jgi:hypothetical protein